MIELKPGRLDFSFPEIHPQAKLTISFQRTLRIPDDGSDYPLPPGLGEFPINHVDDFAENVPSPWLERGGVMMPMFQSEAMWINFTGNRIADRETDYPFAVRIAAGKINAATGNDWTNSPPQNNPQDYMVVPPQPWLDGYCVEKGIIRQFVAMPLGSGYSAEEQITGQAEHGGIQIQVFPMKRDSFEARFPKVDPQILSAERAICYSACAGGSPDMGLAPGGRMKQEIYEDPYGTEEWADAKSNRCFVHLANSLAWREITGKEAPATPATAKAYTTSGFPWFDYYDDKSTILEGAETLAKMKSITELAKQKRDNPLPDNQSVTVDKVINLRAGLNKHEVREGYF